MKRAVILAGGTGTRLAPFTAVLPKPLLPLDDTPIVEVVLRQLAASGFGSITLAVGHLSHLIEAYFGDGSRLGVELEYVREDSPLGTAGALKLVPDLDEPFIWMNGDILTTLDYGAFLQRHIDSGDDISISTYAREHAVDFGVVEADDAGRITGYREKPVSTHLVSMGVYAMNPDILCLIDSGQPLDFPDLVLRAVGLGRLVRSVPFSGYWRDIGRHDDFEQAQADFSADRERFLGAHDSSC